MQCTINNPETVGTPGNLHIFMSHAYRKEQTVAVDKNHLVGKPQYYLAERTINLGRMVRGFCRTNCIILDESECIRCLINLMRNSARERLRYHYNRSGDPFIDDRSLLQKKYLFYIKKKNHMKETELSILTCTTLMHIDVSASPKTKYTMDTIITSWFCEQMLNINGHEINTNILYYYKNID